MKTYAAMLLVAALLSLGLVGCVMQSDLEAFSIDGAVHRVDIQTGAGDIRLVRGGDVVLVEAILSWAGERPEIHTEYRGGVLTLASPCAARGDCQVTFTVTVPGGVDGSARSDRGDVWIDGELDEVQAESARGAVHRS